MGYVKIKDFTAAGTARSPNITAETLINLYYENAAETAKAPNSVYGTPGQILFLDMEFDTPIYAAHSFGGYLYVVVNNRMYVVNANGAVVDLGSVGTINQNVQLDDNGLVVILLTPSGAGYLATPSTLTQITDPDFLGAGSFDVLGGYAVFSIQNSRQFFWSELNDASDYRALSVATAEQSPDNIVRIFRFNADLYIFKEKTFEVWGLTGSADLPFAPKTGLTGNQGCAAKLSVAKLKQSVFWLGDDRSVYQMTGYNYKKISTFEIDNTLNSLTMISDAFSFAYSQEGHNFYVLTFPTEGLTLVYDERTEKWHQRKSFESDRWNVNAYAFAFGKNIVCNSVDSLISELDLNTYTDNGITIERIAITPPLFNDGNRFFCYGVELDIQTGVGTISGQGENPQVQLRISYDGNHLYSDARNRDLGAMGHYKETVRWNNLGYGYEMAFKFTITDPVFVAISGIYAIVKGGNK